MVLFLIKGVDHKTFFETLDGMSLSKDEPMVFGIEGSEFFEIECFDSETGKRYFESEALLMFLELRKKYAQTS